MRWNDLSIPKLQRLHCWSLGMGKKFHPTLYNGCDYLSMLGLKLNHVSQRGPGVCCEFKVKYIMYYFPHWRAVCNILSVQAKLMDILKKNQHMCGTLSSFSHGTSKCKTACMLLSAVYDIPSTKVIFLNILASQINSNMIVHGTASWGNNKAHMKAPHSWSFVRGMHWLPSAFPIVKANIVELWCVLCNPH